MRGSSVPLQKGPKCQGGQRGHVPGQGADPQGAVQLRTGGLRGGGPEGSAHWEAAGSEARPQNQPTPSPGKGQPPLSQSPLQATALLRLAGLPCSALGNTRPRRACGGRRMRGTDTGPVVGAGPGATPLLTSHARFTASTSLRARPGPQAHGDTWRGEPCSSLSHGQGSPQAFGIGAREGAGSRQRRACLRHAPTRERAGGGASPSEDPRSGTPGGQRRGEPVSRFRRSGRLALGGVIQTLPDPPFPRGSSAPHRQPRRRTNVRGPAPAALPGAGDAAAVRACVMRAWRVRASRGEELKVFNWGKRMEGGECTVFLPSGLISEIKVVATEPLNVEPVCCKRFVRVGLSRT